MELSGVKNISKTYGSGGAGKHALKSYLSLIPISAKVHRRQNRMTLLCIIFAVFMVTAVFSMAEMSARMEQTRLLEKHGSLSFAELFQSELGQAFILTAGGVFVLILSAGVLMISSSINSSIAQRVKFFGMMRCIGMSRRQIIRFVRLEALNWCKTAVPIGLVLGIIASWGLCAALRFLVGEEFSNIPLFGFSIIGIVSGIVVGVVTVLLAARAPARRAAKVSPAAAVSGSSESAGAQLHPVKARLVKIETALGIHHAVSARKNLFLMTGSFALSIILFLCFSVLIDFVNCVMPQSAADSDIGITSSDGTNSINSGLVQTLSGMEGVRRAYGRRSCFEIPAGLNGDTTFSTTIDLISYDDFDLDCLKKDGLLKRGSDLSKVYGDSDYVLATWDWNSPWKIGDKIRIGEEELDSLVMVQLTGSADDADVDAIRSTTGNEYVFSDKRDQRTSGTYLAFVTCVYGFLGIITLVSVLNIVNSISMSVSARMKQYGAMRAVGMDEHQVTKMIAAEAFTYAFLGGIIGCGIGVPVSRMIFNFLIVDHFSYVAWSLPVASLAIILLFVVTAAVLAVYAPAKRIRNISVTETINEL